MTYAFISYIREDTALVEKLCNDLRKNNVEVWLDREQIDPGQRWQDAIRTAIEGGAFFLACFSDSYVKREKTYMNEEMYLAVEQMQLRSRDRQWLVPIRLADCELPKLKIGPSEMLDSIQWVDLFDNWDEGVSRLLKVLDAHQAEVPFIFMSGSKVKNEASSAEIERFQRVCQAIGEMLGKLELGIVGCPPHPSRVLASQEARIGALRVNPKLKYYDAEVEFPLNNRERARFVKLASAAVFVGGGLGTMDEFELCIGANISPLIPIAACGGSGAELARRIWNPKSRVLKKKFGGKNLQNVLASSDKAPEQYARAVRAVLESVALERKPKSLITPFGFREQYTTEDWLPQNTSRAQRPPELGGRRGIRMGNLWIGPYGEEIEYDED